MKNFDFFVGIDWSGAKSPFHSKAIIVALAERGQEAPRLVPPTDHHSYWSREDVAKWLLNLAQENMRVLVGVDANFGYAQDVGVAQFGEEYDFMDLWRSVEEKSTPEENFYAQGCWEDWPHIFWTSGKQPFELPKRLTETTCGENGYGVPESPFKLIGPKQVGKGGLSAMRMALELKEKAGDKIAFWPFEKELADHKAAIVITEIYPRQFLTRFGHGNTKIKDIETLNEALSHAKSLPYEGVLDFGGDASMNFVDVENFEGEQDVSDHQTDALIAAVGLRYLCGERRYIPEIYANPPMMDDLTARREGWIFGVGDDGGS